MLRVVRVQAERAELIRALKLSVALNKSLVLGQLGTRHFTRLWMTCCHVDGNTSMPVRLCGCCRGGLSLVGVGITSGEWDGAASAAEEAKILDPSSAKALFRAGTANRHLGNFEKSKADLRRAVELDPKDKCVVGASALLVAAILSRLELGRGCRLVVTVAVAGSSCPVTCRLLTSS